MHKSFEHQLPSARRPRLVAVAQDYGRGADSFAELAKEPNDASQWKGLVVLTKAGRHTLHVNLACCGGLQATFSDPQAALSQPHSPVAGSGDAFEHQ